MRKEPSLPTSRPQQYASHLAPFKLPSLAQLGTFFCVCSLLYLTEYFNKLDMLNMY